VVGRDGVVGPDRDVLVRPATFADAAALGELFRRADCPCHCQYYGFEGDHRAWQLRMATEPEKNANLLVGQLKAGATRGVIALAGGDSVVGWSRLGEPAELGRLYGGRLYKGLPCFDGDRQDVLAVGCLLVDPAERRRGVASALVGGQLDYARALGARAVEAFPRGAVDVSDGEQWMGPLAIYSAFGFRVVHDFAPYPVLRKDL
jgi:GNAT superfamily N-acetyltransferase